MLLSNRPLLPVARLILLAVFVVGVAPVCPAQVPPAAPAAEEKPADATAETPEPGPEIPTAMRSPRAVLKAFIERMREDKKKEAAELLDMSKQAAIAAESRGPDLAYKLYRLIPALGGMPTTSSTDDGLPGDETIAPPAGVAPGLPEAEKEAPAFNGNSGKAVLDFSDVPDKTADREKPWPLADWLTNPSEAAQQVTIERGQDLHWRFSAATVAQIDQLYENSEKQIDKIAKKKAALKAASPDQAATVEETEPTETFSVWFRKQFPPVLRKTYFVLPGYQWLLLLLLLPLGRLVDKLTRVVMTWFGDKLLRRVDPDFDKAHESTARVWRPVGRLAMATVWVIGAFNMDLPGWVPSILLPTLAIVAVVSAVLAIFRVLDLLSGYFLRRAKRRNRKFDDLFVPLITSTVKGLVGVGAVIATISAFSQTLPTTLIGGLGIGGIAIALASQETLSNFIGSITLLFDRPFEVGDWVKVDTIEGEVESLGFRSTRIRTGPNSQVTLPNSKLVGTSVDNLGRRQYRRYLNKLGLQYGTPPERIDAFCEGIRELIRRHPHTRKDFYAAYFNDFGPSSLDIIVVVFFEVPDWVTELRERHRLLNDIVRLADSIGVSFAFPTQTLHLHRGEAAADPPEMADDAPDKFGARSAAEIAGELPNYQDRPGKVKFTGPTPLD